MDHGSESSETLLSSPLFRFSSKSASQEGSYWQAQRTTAIFDHSFHSVQCLEGRKMLQPVQYGGKTVDIWLLTDSNQANLSNYIDKNVNKSFYPEEKSKCKMNYLFIFTVHLHYCLAPLVFSSSFQQTHQTNWRPTTSHRKHENNIHPPLCNT